MKEAIINSLIQDLCWDLFRGGRQSMATRVLVTFDIRQTVLWNVIFDNGFEERQAALRVAGQILSTGFAMTESQC